MFLLRVRARYCFSKSVRPSVHPTHAHNIVERFPPSGTGMVLVANLLLSLHYALSLAAQYIVIGLSDLSVGLFICGVCYHDNSFY